VARRTEPTRLESLQRAIALEPENAEIHNHAGVVYCSLGDLGRAYQQVGLLEFTSGCRELYGVQFLPHMLRPTVLNPEQPATKEAFIAPEFSYWLRPSAVIED
jgi:hypothetical protein